MPYWSAVFFAIAVIAAAFGIAGDSNQASGIVWMLFSVGLILFALSLLLQRPISTDPRRHSRSGIR